MKWPVWFGKHINSPGRLYSLERLEPRELLAIDAAGVLSGSTKELVELDLPADVSQMSPLEILLTAEDVIYFQQPKGDNVEIWFLNPSADTAERLLTTPANIRIEFAFGTGDELFLAYRDRVVITDLPAEGYQDGIDILKSYSVSERLARNLTDLSLWTNDNMFDNELRFINSDAGLVVLHDEIDTDLVHTRFWLTDGNDIDRIGSETFTGLFQDAVNRVVGFGSEFVFDGIQFNINGGDQQQGVWSLDTDASSLEVIIEFDTPVGEFEFSPRGPRELTAFKGHVYFTIDDGSNGLELWRTDTQTAELFADLHATASSTPHQLTAVGEQLFFFADAGLAGNQLWVTDGARTQSVETADSFDGIVNTIAFQRELVFFSNTTGGVGLWRSDGTAAGTQRFALLDGSVPEGSQPILVGNRVLFLFDDGIHGSEWWVTDGTQAGTELAVDLRPGRESSQPQDQLVRGNELIFAADDGDGFDIWSITIDAAVSLPGDVNSDNTVDFVDFLVVSENFGRAVDGGRSVGDFNGDGDVDFLDFLVISNHFGQRQ